MQVERAGTAGSALILLPGSMCGPWEWRSTIEALRRDHTVYAVAFPGFDDAPAPADTSDLIGRYTDEVVALISAQHLNKPIVIGHSIGGTIALHLAATHPDLLAAVVAVDGLPVFPGTEDIPAQQRTQSADAIAATTRTAQTPDAKLVFARNYMRSTGVIDPALADRYAPMMARSDFTTAAAYLREDLLIDNRAELAAATIPIWEIAPYYAPSDRPDSTAEDKVSYYRELLRAAPHVTVVPMQPSKHFVMLDQPGVFADTLHRILADLPA
ncbi:alpha/beta fold hydrolase [Nocardia sp. NBC_01327]|uniref:alpha/beta fold hydrolase n=1 Tax=Nocardia sp. NBC_01327 TaxID=2903593 RepID=UPI002E0E9E66|nr:alpha/beta hydrolase [Nocardia sp. NBC_01327]